MKLRFEPGTGLLVESGDGAFALSTRLRAQFRYTVADEEGEDASQLLNIRRARVLFGGHVFGKHNKFKAELAFSPNDESVRAGTGPTLTPLLDWFAEFDYIKNANLRVGQYKVPFNRQRVISSGDLQLVDRSLAQSEFTLDRDIGMHVFSPDLGGHGLFRYYAGAWMNEGRDVTGFRTFDMMYIGRVEVLPFGMFDDYKEADLKRHEGPRLSVGLAYAYLDDALRERGILGSVPDDEGTTDVHVATADAMFKMKGLSVFGEVFYRKGDRTSGGAVDETGAPIPTAAPRDGMGWSAQAGYVLPRRPLELVARYSGVRPVGDDSALEKEHEVGGGLSWYPGGHSLKLQGDYFHTWGDPGSADQVRLQLQVAY